METEKEGLLVGDAVAAMVFMGGATALFGALLVPLSLLLLRGGLVTSAIFGVAESLGLVAVGASTCRAACDLRRLEKVRGCGFSPLRIAFALGRWRRRLGLYRVAIALVASASLATLLFAVAAYLSGER